jgi:hypothetical protein
MRICVVSFDLRHPPHVYVPLDNHLEKLKLQKLQTHLWAGSGDFTPEDLKTSVVEYLQPDDGVFVFLQESATDDYASHNPIR